MNIAKKRKLFKYGLFCSLSMLAIIPTFHLLKSKTEFNESTLNSSDFKQQNDELIMSKNIGFPVYTIHKTGHDAERINFLVAGNGFKKSDEKKFIDYVNSITQTLLDFEPYKQFSHLINIYAILATDEDESKDYFDIKTSFGIYTIGSPGKTKLKNVIDKLEHSFLDKGGQIDDVSIATIAPGREVAYAWAHLEFRERWLNIIQGDFTRFGVYLHETGHSFARLGDEYPGGGGDGGSPNLASSEEHAKTKWGEFFGFRGIAARWARQGLYRPSDKCLMISSDGQLCEVCKYNLFLKLKQITESRGSKDEINLYIANPSITLKHEDYAAHQELAEDGVYGTKPITDAQDNEIDFSTIIRNFTNSKKNFKLKLKIEKEDRSKSKEWEKEFEVKPNELKKLTLITEKVTNSIYQIDSSDSIYGEVIDLSTNKVIESRKTFGQRYLDYKNVNLSYKLYENGKTDKDIPYYFLGNKHFSLKNGTNFTFTPPTLKGYKYKEAKGDLSFQADSNKEITLYYEKLPSKTFTIQLKDEDGNVVQTKQQTIHENEVFVPGFYDFLIINEHTNLLDNKKSIPESNKIWKYNEIEDQKLLLTYNIVPDATPMFNHYRVVLDYGSTWDHTPYNWAFSYLWDRDHFSAITKNDVDTSKPGIYYVSYLTSNADWQHEGVTVSFKRNNTIKVIVKNQDGSLPDENNIDEQLKTEKARIDSSYFYLMKWRYRTEEINSMNEQNLFEKFVYGIKKQSDFTYEVINLNKNESNKIKFNLRIKKGEQSIDSNEISLFYKKTDSSQPEQDQDLQKIKEEKNRIDKLTLSLKKEKYSYDEIKAINSTNLLSELNGWSTNSDFSYEIVEFSNNNTNKIDFKIKITKNQKYDLSKLFSLSYQLISEPTDPIQQELQNEKNKIDSFNLSLVKEEYSQSEIDNLTSESLMSELKNLTLDNKFSYSIINFKKDTSNKNISFQIRITKDEKSVETKEFNLKYKLSSTGNDNNNNNENKGNNNLPIILSATLVPISLVILGVIGYTFIRIKKNR